MLIIGPVLGLLLGLWLVRETPWQPLAWLRIDGLSLFFALLLIGATSWNALTQPPLRWPQLIVAACLVPALVLNWLPGIVGLYLLLALLSWWFPPTKVLTRRLQLPLASALLLIGYSLLIFDGAWLYDSPLSRVALSSSAFWFTLLATLTALAPLEEQHPTLPSAPWHALLPLFWLYPLVRLYSMGTWNTGWSLATMLPGAALALWAAVQAIRRPNADLPGLLVHGYAGLALAGFGLSSGAGIAAGCYALLAALVLYFGNLPQPSTVQRQLSYIKRRGLRIRATKRLKSVFRSSRIAFLHPTRVKHQRTSSTPRTRLLLGPIIVSPLLPFALPFVAAWMLIGAAFGGGAVALAGITWLVVLLFGWALAISHPALPPRSVAIVSLLLGIGAPFALQLLVLPAVGQLQAGLTPFGELTIWPWIGVALLNSAKAEVAVLPSLLVALLMIVLAAGGFLLSRNPQSSPTPSGSTDRSWLRRFLLHEVPWLGGGQRRDID
jgi:hypothetical protein